MFIFIDPQTIMHKECAAKMCVICPYTKFHSGLLVITFKPKNEEHCFHGHHVIILHPEKSTNSASFKNVLLYPKVFGACDASAMLSLPVVGNYKLRLTGDL
jgi:hypothetical protein